MAHQLEAEAAPWPLTCSACGVAIGAMEPFWWDRPGIARKLLGYLELKQQPGRSNPSARFFHADCPLCAAAAGQPR